MTETSTQPDWRRPLETELDLSPMPAPLHWAEGGQVVRVCGTRISLDSIVARYRQGCTPLMIAESYPGVGLANVFSVIAYYLNHQKAVHAYLCEREERAHEISARAYADGLMSPESWQMWCEERPERIRWASGR